MHLPVSPAAAREQQAATVRKPKTKSKSANVVAAGNSGVHHKVKQGETLYSIANSYNTTVTALKRANSNIATLRPGMVLIIRP